MEKVRVKRPRKLQEELLGRYYRVEDGRATVELCFDTFAELIDQNVGNDSVELLNGVLQEKLDQAFSLMPRRLFVEVEIKIKDFGEYAPEEAERIIRDNIGLKVYALAMESLRKRKAGLILLGAGVLLLIGSYFLGRLNWPRIFYDVVNISGTLFVWQAADVAFIERGSAAKRAKQYLKKLKAVRVLQAQ